jgi:group I intron endonuclease
MPKMTKTGVYKIVNKTTGRFYVGSSIRCLNGRWKGHQTALKNGVHDNKHLQKDYNQFGIEIFEFVILEKCQSSKCREREQYWLDYLKSIKGATWYNIGLDVIAAMKGRNHSEDSCKQMSEKRKGILPVAATAAAAIVNKGTPRSEEIRRKISRAQIGKELTNEHKANIKRTHWTKGPNAQEILLRIVQTKREKGLCQ